MNKTQTQNQHRYHHHTSIQIRFNDIDQLAHVTNSVYQQYFDLGRLKYFTDVFGLQMDWEKEGLILASITIDYLKPIKMWDEIEVLSMVYEIGNKSLKMRQEIFNHTTGEVSATSASVMVCYSNSKGQTITIPDEWRKSIINFENEVKLRV